MQRFLINNKFWNKNEKLSWTATAMHKYIVVSFLYDNKCYLGTKVVDLMMLISVCCQVWAIYYLPQVRTPILLFLLKNVPSECKNKAIYSKDILVCSTYYLYVYE